MYGKIPLDWKKVCILLLILLLVYYYLGTLFGNRKSYKIYGNNNEYKYTLHIVPGLGENGKAAYLNAGSEAEELKIRNGWSEYGFNAWLSEHISLQRKLIDFKDKGCASQPTAHDLPDVSIIIISHNENPHVLLRTIHSLFERTPADLLRQIIIVDDKSDNIDLKAFNTYIKYHFNDIVKILQLEQQVGLIRARIFGAKHAKGQVLVFMDAHIEATEGWLPPLLTPIKTNSKICTTPIIDVIKYDNFEYVPVQPSRGAFNWDFNYVQLALLPEEERALPTPHINPIMNGGLFAINAKWFWHLGAYDQHMEIWGAEQFELSLKLWLCGGKILEVPCARVGHLYRHADFRINYTRQDIKGSIERNYKRVVEVWLDEYKDFIYQRNSILTLTQAGDLSEQHALRKRLQCKPFKWFLKHIAPDLIQIYPPVEPIDYAFGGVQSVAAPNLCLDALHRRSLQPSLSACSEELKYPKSTQRWTLSFRRDLRVFGGICLEVRVWLRNAPVWLWPCHLKAGNQYWYYDVQTQMLVQGEREHTEQRCLEADLLSKRVYVNACDFGNSKQQWRFGYVNQTAIKHFYANLTTLI